MVFFNGKSDYNCVKFSAIIGIPDNLSIRIVTMHKSHAPIVQVTTSNVECQSMGNHHNIYLLPSDHSIIIYTSRHVSPDFRISSAWRSNRADPPCAGHHNSALLRLDPYERYAFATAQQKIWDLISGFPLLLIGLLLHAPPDCMRMSARPMQ